MHYHCEVILPPDTEDIADAVETIMVPFCENNDSKFARRFSFYDYYVLGGQFVSESIKYVSDIQGHSKPQVMKLSEAKYIECRRVIFAGPSFDVATTDFTGPLEAVFMISDNIENGVNRIDVNWDTTIGGAEQQFIFYRNNYPVRRWNSIEPTDNWLAVTVDYHS